MDTFSSEVCIICHEGFDVYLHDRVRVTSKGLKSIAEFCDLYNDIDLREYLSTNPPEVFTHERCRKRYTDRRRTNSSSSECFSPIAKKSKSLRSSSTEFDWKQNCCLCGQLLDVDERHSDRHCARNTVRAVQTLEIKDSILNVCLKRQDKWSIEVQSRFQMCNDLVAAEAVYHKTCHDAFLQGRAVPVSWNNPQVDKSSKLDTGKMAIFEQLCEWLETVDGQLHTLEEFHRRMTEMSGCAEDVYSMRHLKRKLVEKYGSHIQFNSVSGRQTVICFTDLASAIINDKWYSERKRNAEDDSLRIVTAAAKLIKSQIRQTLYTTDEYPSLRSSNIEDLKSWVPDLLLAFIQELTGNELKQTALSHCLVQAVRPKSVLSPLLCGLGVSLDHTLGSKWLLNVLSRLGLCISWDEVHRYRQCVVRSDVGDLQLDPSDSFTQFAADNVDHNIATLDGKGTFHGMGIISMSTHMNSERRDSYIADKPIRRLQRTTMSKVIEGHSIPLLHYSAAQISALSTVQFSAYSSLAQLTSDSEHHRSINSDILWHVGSMFSDIQHRRPGWLGFMQSIHDSPNHPAVADVRLLPMIDRNPNDISTIYSTLCFVHDQAAKFSSTAAVITFDQPLWLKAVEVSVTKNLNVVCRLGGFHVIMNFMGSIGHVMAGSGLQEAFETCYGQNAVVHMLTGKAYDRAVRAHFLTESALYTLLMRHIFSEAASGENGYLADINWTRIQKLYTDLVEGNNDTDEEAIASLRLLQSAVVQLMSELSSQSRTAKLWVQYLHYVSVLKKFIRAERTSDWHLHLLATSEMLNLFAATGHSHYAKCSRLYLQMMMKLPESHPDVYRAFTSGMHTVRRSNRYWGGLSTDLAIEQVLMRSVKSRGGLTHGRGMSESVRTTWVKTMHVCTEVHSAVMSLTGLDKVTDGLHQELSSSRMQRDNNDLAKLVGWFSDHNPFCTEDITLHSLASGISACDADLVNCDEAENIGTVIMQSFDNIPYAAAVLKKADRVVPLSELLNSMAVCKKKPQIDQNVLFTRLLFIMQRPENNDMEKYFSYELTSLPCSLFSDGFLRKCAKSALAHELCSKTETPLSSPRSMCYVVDGGYLLHKVKWKSGNTYSEVIDQYLSYIRSHCPTDVHVVFDGYSDQPTIKDHEHKRRASKVSPDCIVDELTVAYKDQQSFLSNSKNKSRFLPLLINRLKSLGYDVNQAVDDADTNVAYTALQLSRSGKSVTVLANDTDVLILLIYHVDVSKSEIFMQYETSGNKKVVNVSIHGIRQSLSLNSVCQLLCAHAISGCDTTSAMFRRGKVSIWRLMSQSTVTPSLCHIISQVDAAHEDVLTAGLKLLVIIYGGKPEDSLNRLRYTHYMNMLASSLTPRPDRLPPSENAAKFHIFRAHCQVIHWKTLGSDTLKPDDWGWSLVNGSYMPVATDLPPAPDNLLKVIRCMQM